MSILIDAQSRVIIQGITGRRGARMAGEMLAYGTQVVGGVSPGRGGAEVEGLPVFDTVADAVASTGADTSAVVVPGLPHGASAVLEAARAGIRLAAWMADPVPVHDMIQLKADIRDSGMLLIGPNTPGLIAPGKCKVGFMPTPAYRPGPVGVISKSGSLSYEVAARLSRAGIGQSTVVGIGGDPVKGISMVEVARRFDADPETELILSLCEIGGMEEYQLAEAIRDGGITTPVVCLVVGAVAPPGKKLGHAGTLMLREQEGFAEKVDALRDAGAVVVSSLSSLVDGVQRTLPVREEAVA